MAYQTFLPTSQRSQLNLVAHHGNIKDQKFGVCWFEKFDLVFNALDNTSARKHVNRMCLASSKPLFEAGTTGYDGQSQIHLKGETI